MNNLDILKELIIVYGSTTVSSIIFNNIYFCKRNKEAYIESKRKLKFRNLSLKPCLMLNNVREVYNLSNKISILLSTIPGYQLVYTIRNITSGSGRFSEYFDNEIEKINNEETKIRKKYLQEIKIAPKIPDDIKTKLENEDYLPSEEDLRRVLDHNKPKVLVNNKNLKIIRRDIENN